MADSFSQVLVHLTFHVKSTGVTIAKDDLPRVFQYIGGIVRSLKGVPMAVGGMPDHVHILSSIPKTISIADFVMNIKKSSSKWVKILGKDMRVLHGKTDMAFSRLVTPYGITLLDTSRIRKNITVGNRFKKSIGLFWNQTVLIMKRNTCDILMPLRGEDVFCIVYRGRCPRLRTYAPAGLM